MREYTYIYAQQERESLKTRQYNGTHKNILMSKTEAN